MKTCIDILYLSEADMIQAGVRDVGKCLSSMEDMFMLLNCEDYRMGGMEANEHGVEVSFPKSSNIEGMPVHKPDFRFMAMPAYLGGRFRVFGIKSYGSNPDNFQKGLPRSILMLQLLDALTGQPMAYMSANILSAMRTGCASGIGVKYLARKDSDTIAVVGPGAMSRYSMMAFLEVLPHISRVKIKGRGKANLDSFIRFCKREFPGIHTFEVCNSLKDACRDADIVFFGTTNVAKYEDNPTVKREWLKKGALVISVSALLVQPELLAAPEVKLISDNYRMYESWGKGQRFPTQRYVSKLLGMGFYDAVIFGKIKRESITDIGEVICKNRSGRDSDDQIILYAVGGLPIEDVAWGYDVYQNACRAGIGTRLNLWESPQL